MKKDSIFTSLHDSINIMWEDREIIRRTTVAGSNYKSGSDDI